MQSLSLKVVWLTVFSLGLLAIPPNSLAQELSTKDSQTKDAVDRLTRKNLQAIRDAIEKYSLRRENLTTRGPFRTVRANLHVHSELSHDSRGKIEDIVAAAKRAGTEVLLFTEHPSKEKDFFEDGHRGLRDGVLLIPGAEMKGMLVYPTMSLRPFENADSQQTTQIVRNRGGHVFLSHLEERMDWQIQGLTGVEIYNTHADFKKQKRMIDSMKNPLWLIKTAELIDRYPQEAFSALQTYPDDYLARWDQLCLIAPHTGVAANDAHQNVGVRILLGEDGKVLVTDALGEELLKLERLLVAPLLKIPDTAKPGDMLLKLQLDPYQYSLRHAGTHLLVSDLTQEAVWNALDEGRTFVAFDWIADSKGFEVAIEHQQNRHEIGSHLDWEFLKNKEDLKLVGQAPLNAKWKVYRTSPESPSELVYQGEHQKFTWQIPGPGNYRVELWLELLDQPHCWILTSPFYIAP
ncbi:MAG: PHP domain-containing protein [Planctomycetota bacterium]